MRCIDYTIMLHGTIHNYCPSPYNDHAPHKHLQLLHRNDMAYW